MVEAIVERDSTIMSAPFDETGAGDDSPSYVDTPRGLFSESGIWFHVREESLRRYAGPVLDHESVSGLLDQAAVWLRSGQTIALWGLLGFLTLLSPLGAVGLTLLLYLFWETIGPSAANRILIPVFRVLERPFVQMAGYVPILSWLAQADEFWAVGTGLLGFILFRWNVVERAASPLIDRLRAPIYAMPVADHVLRLLIVRAAVRHDVPLPDVDAIREDVLRRLRQE